MKDFSWRWPEGSVTVEEESECYAEAGFEDGGESMRQAMGMVSWQGNESLLELPQRNTALLMS